MKKLGLMEIKKSLPKLVKALKKLLTIFDGVVKSPIYGVVAFWHTICMAEGLLNHHASESRCVRLPVYRTFRSLRLADLSIFS